MPLFSTRHPDETDADQPIPVAGCPFCGAMPTLEPAVHHGYTISCNAYACPTQPETRPYDTAEQAADAWNARGSGGRSPVQPAEHGHAIEAEQHHGHAK